MSYLSTIVHPLIIIRLLEHRLFTPLLKKTTNTRATPSVSLSMSAACSNAIAPLTASSSTSNNQLPAGGAVGGSGSFLKTSSQLQDPSTVGPGIYHKKSLQCGPTSPGASMQKRKCSEGYFNMTSSEFDRDRGSASQRKHSQASIFLFRSVSRPHYYILLKNLFEFFSNSCF